MVELIIFAVFAVAAFYFLTRKKNHAPPSPYPEPTTPDPVDDPATGSKGDDVRHN